MQVRSDGKNGRLDYRFGGNFKPFGGPRTLGKADVRSRERISDPAGSRGSKQRVF